MKKTSQTRTRRSYRLIGGMTFLSLVISVLCGVFVSFDACLSAVFGGITVITLGAIMRAAVESAAELPDELFELRRVGLTAGASTPDADVDEMSAAFAAAGFRIGEDPTAE